MAFESENKDKVIRYLREGLEFVPKALELGEMPTPLYNTWARKVKRNLTDSEAMFVMEIVVAAGLAATGMLQVDQQPMGGEDVDDPLQTG